MEHLQGLPSSATDTLCAVGCICITEPRADCVSPILRRLDPLTTAIGAASSRLRLPLQQMLSQQRIGSITFAAVRELLADYVSSSSSNTSAAWQVLQQCPIFEKVSGRMAALPEADSWCLLPNSTWENHSAELEPLLRKTPVKYHTTSDIQPRLLDHSDVEVPSLIYFLRCELLPAITQANISSSEPQLLLALDELAQSSRQSSVGLHSVFVDSRLHPVDRTVDSTSSLLQTLFSLPKAGDDYKLLPQQYTTASRLAVLKRHGLLHEHVSEPKLFLHCIKRFSLNRASMSRDVSKKLSRSLVSMLHANVGEYQKAGDWSSARVALRASPVFKTADLQFPYYNKAHPEFASLSHSADHNFYSWCHCPLQSLTMHMGTPRVCRAGLAWPYNQSCSM